MFKFHGILWASPSGQAKKILEYLLYLFIFLLSWQTRWIIYDPLINGNVWEYGRISIYSFDIIFAVVLLLYSHILIKHREKLVIGNWKLIISFITLLLYFFIIILWADYKVLSLYWSLRILEGILLVWIISKIEFNKIKLAWSFVAGVSLSAVLGIYQFLTQSAFASKWLGLAEHAPDVLGDSVIELASGRWLRAYGSFPHPNILAGFIVLAIILVFWMMSQKTQEAQKTLLLYYSITLLLITSLFFTFSRAAWIVFLLVTGYWLLVTFRKDKGLFKIVFLCFLCFCVFCAIFWSLVQTRLNLTDGARLEVMSNEQRMGGYKQSFEIIKNNLWLGTGLGNYTVELQKLYPNKNAWDYQPVHNVYLLVLSELGLVGLLLIIVLLYYFIKKLEIRNWKLKIFPLLLITYYLLLFLFDHFWWTLPSGMLIVFLSLAFLVTQTFRSDKKQGYLSASGGKPCVTKLVKI